VTSPRVGQADTALIGEVRRALAAAEDLTKAAGMQAYLKSAMPCRGALRPAQRQIFRAAFAAHPQPDRPAWEATVREMWREAGYREERYAAIALTGYPRYRGWQDTETMPIYQEMVVTGAWWDYVDEVAIRRIGPILLAHPATMVPMMLAWSRDRDLWTRRAAIICQVGAKAATDTALLRACIIPNLGDREFFLQKGIGWALREHAKHDPDWVRSFVAEFDGQLSPLSHREACKHL
jgi:3-methyladenine DNA glycosylase AlkD